MIEEASQSLCERQQLSEDEDDESRGRLVSQRYDSKSDGSPGNPSVGGIDYING